MHKFGAVVVAAVGTLACSAVPSAPETDSSPLTPTAVIETRIVTDENVKGLFPSESIEISYVRPNMRRDEISVKGTSKVTKFLVGSNAETRIWRLDRGVVWALKPNSQEYLECPLTGCAAPAKTSSEESKPAQPEPLFEPGCTMKVVEKNFSAKPTGKKRSINGFETEGHLLEWQVVLQDIIDRRTTSTVSVNVWTTDVTPALKKAIDIQQAYAQALAGKAGAGDGLLPAEIMQAVASGLGGALSPADQAAFLHTGKQLEKLKGHPVSTRLEWSLKGEACARREPPSEGGISSVTGIFKSKKKKEEEAKVAASKPIVSIITEVKALKMDLIRDSAFNVPKDYKQAK